MWTACPPQQLPPPPAPGEVQLWLLSLDEPAWPSAQLHALLDDDEAARAARFVFPQHRLRFAHGRGLLRTLLAHATGLAPEALRFAYGPQGKPRLAGTAAAARPALRFNLSHSGSMALLGLAQGADIGVDIELPRAVPELQAIARSNFAPAEYQALMALAPERRADAFLAGWTRKEAFIKALGGGLSIPLASFEVTLDAQQPARLLHVADAQMPPEHFTLWAGRGAHDAWVACVVREPHAAVRNFSLR